MGEAVIRWGLVALGVSALAVGLPALFAPASFFGDFPFVAHWVDRLGDYNQHLTTDVGALYLAFAVLFFWAAATLSRELVLAACSAWAVAATAHLVFHVTHLDGFPATDAAAQTVSLMAVLAVALAIIIAVRRA